jgi:hypothetical protein
MASTSHLNDVSNENTHAVESISNAHQSRKTSHNVPTTGPLDPEALTGIETTAACDSNPQQKIDDMYLLYFDQPFDSEK